MILPDISIIHHEIQNIPDFMVYRLIKLQNLSQEKNRVTFQKPNGFLKSQ